MALNHVANSARLVIERGALANANGFRGGNLHMIDVAMIPHRLKQRIGETKHQQILHNFFSKVVINSVNRVLFKHASKRAVQTARAFVVKTKRLLNNNALPGFVVGRNAAPTAPLGHHCGRVNLRHDGLVQLRRHAHEEQNILRALALRIKFRHARRKPWIRLAGGGVARHVKNSLGKFRPHVLAETLHLFLQPRFQFIAPLGVRLYSAAHAKNACGGI